MSYCQTLNDSQVIEVLKQEQDRVDRFATIDSRSPEAEELVRDARETLIRRGISPDDVLAGSL